MKMTQVRRADEDVDVCDNDEEEDEGTMPVRRPTAASSAAPTLKLLLGREWNVTAKVVAAAEPDDDENDDTQFVSFIEFSYFRRKIKFVLCRYDKIA